MGLFTIGKVVCGKIIEIGKHFNDYGGMHCVVKLEDGSLGYLNHDDISWSIDELEDDLNIELSKYKVAESLLGRKMNFQIIMLSESGGVLLSRKVLLEHPLYIFKHQRDLFSGTVLSKDNVEATIQVNVDTNLQLIGFDEYSIILGKLLKFVSSNAQWKKVVRNEDVQLRIGMIDYKHRSILFLPRNSKFRYSKGRKYVNTKVGDLIISANELHFLTFEFMCPECHRVLKYDLLQYFMIDSNIYIHICGKCNYITTSMLSTAALAHFDMLRNYPPTFNLIYRIKEAFEKKDEKQLG